MLYRAGCISFSFQSDAEAYLFALPFPFEGRTWKSESGKWMCSYRRKEQP